MTENLIHKYNIDGWTIGILQERELMPDQGWDVMPNDSKGEHLVFEKKGSEHLIAWIDVMRSDGSIFSNCTVPTHVNVDYKKKIIRIGFLLPELSSPPNQLNK